MKALILQHVIFEGPGYIQKWLINNNINFSIVHLYNNEKLPNQNDFDFLIVMGGPMGIYDYEKFSWLKEEQDFISAAIDNKKKVLGICLGSQLIANSLGSRVYKNSFTEIGWFNCKRKSSYIDDLFPEIIFPFHWHGDTFDLPDKATHLFESEGCKNQAFIYDNRVLAFQFHLEATEESASLLIKNSPDDFVNGKYISSPEEILANREAFLQSNILMKKILDYVKRVFS